MSGWSLAVDIVAVTAGVVAILSYFGITPKSNGGGAATPLSRKWKLVIMLGLMAVSLGLSGYGFYRSLRPTLVEKIVERPVDRIVEKSVLIPCPKVPGLGSNSKVRGKKAEQPPQTQFCEGGNCAQSTGQTGGVTAGVFVDTPPLKITWEAKEAVSEKPEFPYAKQVTISTNTLYMPVSLAVICDATVDNISLYGAISNVSTAFEQHAAFFKFSTPAISPGSPLIVQVQSKHPFTVKDVQQAKIN